MHTPAATSIFIQTYTHACIYVCKKLCVFDLLLGIYRVFAGLYTDFIRFSQGFYNHGFELGGTFGF